jgi:predicted nucleic acid-binding protein
MAAFPRDDGFWYAAQIDADLARNGQAIDAADSSIAASAL